MYEIINNEIKKNPSLTEEELGETSMESSDSLHAFPPSLACLEKHFSLCIHPLHLVWQ